MPPMDDISTEPPETLVSPWSFGRLVFAVVLFLAAAASLWAGGYALIAYLGVRHDAELLASRWSFILWLASGAGALFAITLCYGAALVAGRLNRLGYGAYFVSAPVVVLMAVGMAGETANAFDLDILSSGGWFIVTVLALVVTGAFLFSLRWRR